MESYLKQSESTIVTRLSHEGDICQIAKLGKQLWLELDYASVVEYDEESVIETCLQLHHNGVLLVSTDDGTIVGFAGAVVTPIFFNIKHRTLSEVFWWVEPAYRCEGVGTMLLQCLEDAAIEHKCRFISPILHRNAAEGQAGKLMAHLGYDAIETTYVKEVPWELSPQ